MKVLFCNVPMIENHDGVIWTGPNAGSCWPHCVPGLYSYVPFPFFLANATSYLRAHGVDAHMFDAWAHRITDYQTVKEGIFLHTPDMLILEVGTPVVNQILPIAEWAKHTIGCKIVLTGPHIAAMADDLLAKSFVDHVVAGEYESACLKIAQGDTRRKIEHEMVRDVDTVNGQPWHPYRDPDTLKNYLDPSMYSGGFQVQINDARGCPGFQCTFCAWPEVMYEHKYRARKASTVLQELRELKEKYPVSSWFFDSETWNGGRKERIVEMCAGLKDIGLPWTFMGRTDQSTDAEWDMFVKSGCVGCRLGAESFHDRLLKAVNKKLDPEVSRRTIDRIITHYPGFHLRLLTMHNLPGETADEEYADDAAFADIVRRGAANGVRVDIQKASMMPLPGTKLWRQMQAAGAGKEMENFEEFQPLRPGLSERLRAYHAPAPSDALTVKGK